MVWRRLAERRSRSVSNKGRALAQFAGESIEKEPHVANHSYCYLYHKYVYHLSLSLSLSLFFFFFLMHSNFVLLPSSPGS